MWLHCLPSCLISTHSDLWLQIRWTFRKSEQQPSFSWLLTFPTKADLRSLSEYKHIFPWFSVWKVTVVKHDTLASGLFIFPPFYFQKAVREKRDQPVKRNKNRSPPKKRMKEKTVEKRWRWYIQQHASFLVLQYHFHKRDTTNGKICVALELDREGSKSQLRHTEPPQGISLSTKKINGGGWKHQIGEICATVARHYIPARTTTIWHVISSERQNGMRWSQLSFNTETRSAILTHKHHHVTLCARFFSFKPLQCRVTTSVFTRTILLNIISVQNTYIHLHLFVLLQNRASTIWPLSDLPFFRNCQRAYTLTCRGV